MTALIVIFITLSLMGSALWVLPPKKERQRMALRMHARKLGLIVQLTSIDLPDKWDKSMNSQKIAAYSYYRLKPLRSLSDDVLLVPYDVWKYQNLVKGWWFSHTIDVDDEIKRVLEKHSDLLKGVKITSDYVAFYWHENADETILEELSELVFSLIKVDSVIT